MQLDITLYGREECGLCDKLRDAIRPLEQELNLTIHQVDIDSRSDWKQRFGLIIPLLVPGLPGTTAPLLCRTRLDQRGIDTIRAWAQQQKAIVIDTQHDQK